MASTQTTLQQHDFVYEKPAMRWIDGVPLGNGVIGAMLWGDGAPLRMNLDKYDIWETRENWPDPSIHNYPRVKGMVQEGKLVELQNDLALEDKPWHEQQPYCTRLPLPRIQWQATPMHKGRLCLHTATWQGDGWQAFVHASLPLLVMPGVQARDIQLFYPAMDDPSVSQDIRRMGHAWGWATDCMKAWGYPPLQRDAEGPLGWCIQHVPDGGQWVIAWQQRDDGLLWTVQTHRDAPDPLAHACELLTNAPAMAELHAEHCQWWDQYWSQSSVSLPDKRVENLFVAEIYKLGSTMRPDGLATSLGGLWMQEAAMPYCWGDYHLDLNVQQAYWPIYTANRLELGFSLYDHFHRLMPRFAQMCRDFYGIEGLWAPCSIGLDGQYISAKFRRDDAGWSPLSCTPSCLAWLAHNFWLHYRYSMDQTFLRERVLPLLEGCWKVYEAVLVEGDDGRLHLPICHSPEFGECTPQAWQQDSSFDRASIVFIAQALIEAEADLGHQQHTPACRAALERLYDYPGQSTFHIARDLPYHASHRHPAHLACIHPFGVLSIEDDAATVARLACGLRDYIRMGQGMWVGHTFSQMALIAARMGKGNMAWRMIQEYFTVLGANSFTHSVDERSFGATSLAGVAVTAVDSGFGMAAGILEMLLQSCNGLIRVFPAVPDCWADIRFDHLLAEGNVQVSAERRGGRLASITLESARAQRVRVGNSFAGPVLLDGQPVSGAVMEIPMQAGQRARLTAADAAHDDDATPAAEPLVPARHWFGVKTCPLF